MLKSAAIKILNIARHLERHGCGLKSAGLESFTIDGSGAPVFMDPGCVWPEDTRPFPVADFFVSFVGPLVLCARRPELARIVRRSLPMRQAEFSALRFPLTTRVASLLSAHKMTTRSGRYLADILAHSQIITLLSLHLWRMVPRFLLRLFGRFRRRKFLDETRLSRLQERVTAISFGRVLGNWSHYYDCHPLEEIAADTGSWRAHYDSDRARAIMQLLESEERGSLLDIGCNRGYFSLMAAKLGYTVSAIDGDIEAVDRFYCSLKRHAHAMPIRATVMDFANLDHERYRFEADVVMALGIAHHLRRVDLIPWQHIATLLAGVTRRTLITEFKEGTKAWNGREITEELEGDYTLERFSSSLAGKFASVEIVRHRDQYSNAGSRILIVCQK